MPDRAECRSRRGEAVRCREVCLRGRDRLDRAHRTAHGYDEYCLVNTRTAHFALITKKRFRVLRPEFHYRTTKESPDHPKLLLCLNLCGTLCATVRPRYTLSAASTSAISSDRSSWLRLPPLASPRLGAQVLAREKVVARGRRNCLHVLLPLRTRCVAHRFFCLSRVREVPSQSGRRGGV